MRLLRFVILDFGCFGISGGGNRIFDLICSTAPVQRGFLTTRHDRGFFKSFEWVRQWPKTASLGGFASILQGLKLEFRFQVCLGLGVAGCGVEKKRTSAVSCLGRMFRFPSEDNLSLTSGPKLCGSGLPTQRPTLERYSPEHVSNHLTPGVLNPRACPSNLSLNCLNLGIRKP